jgi:hypothetical protein
MGERRFSGFATILLVNGLGLMPVAWYGSEEQKRKWIGAATSDKNHEYLAGWTVSEPAGTPGGTANFDHLGVRPAFITAGRKIFSRQGRSDWLAIWPGPRRRTRSRTGVSIRILPRCVCAHRAGSSWRPSARGLIDAQRPDLPAGAAGLEPLHQEFCIPAGFTAVVACERGRSCTRLLGVRHTICCHSLRRTMR